MLFEYFSLAGEEMFYPVRTDFTNGYVFFYVEVQLYDVELCLPVGLHPTSVKTDWETEFNIIKAELQRRKYIAIGEIGIDLY